VGKFRPGQSGNAKGRPLKTRAWASLLEKYADEYIYLADGEKVFARDLIAKLTIEALYTGRVNFPKILGDKRKPRAFNMTVKDWARFLAKTRSHIEPGPPQIIELGTEDLGEIVKYYLPNNGREQDEDEASDDTDNTPDSTDSE
jgi:hypothetical protein